MVSRRRLVSSPPVGMAGDKAILIHMAGYEDWRPRCRDDSSSRTSSEYGSSALMIVPFNWTPGVLDGRPALSRHRDPNDDFRGSRSSDDVLKRSKVRQLFPGCTPERAVRVRTRSLPSYRCALVRDQAPTNRGCPNSRSPVKGGRVRDYLPHTSEDWEQRRSCSPARQTSARVLVSYDPLIDLCRVHGDSMSQETFTTHDEDPMIREALLVPTSAIAPMRFSPDDGGEVVRSLEYRPVSSLWADKSSVGRAVARNQSEVTLGPGIQLDGANIDAAMHSQA